MCVASAPLPSTEAPWHTTRARLAATAHRPCGAWPPPNLGNMLLSTCYHKGAARRGSSRPWHTARARLAMAANRPCVAWRPPSPGHMLLLTCWHEDAVSRGSSKLVRAMPPTNRAPRHGSAATGRGASWPSTRDDIILKRSGVCAARGPSMLPPVARPGGGKFFRQSHAGPTLEDPRAPCDCRPDFFQ